MTRNRKHQSHQRMIKEIVMTFLAIERDKEQHSQHRSIYYCFIQPHPLDGFSDMFDSMLHALVVNWSAKLEREKEKNQSQTHSDQTCHAT